MAKWWQDEGAKRAYQRLLAEAEQARRRGDGDAEASARFYANDVVDNAKRRAREKGGR